jgi:RNA polymerase sigma factor (sigma-70 family)
MRHSPRFRDVSNGIALLEPSSSSERRHMLALWVAREILPHEARVRAWLRRAHASPEDVDEIIQEAYCRLSTLDGVEHIETPYAYFFSMARNLLVRRLRRQQIVPLDALAQIDAYEDDRPSPEQMTSAKLSYRKVLSMIDGLPERCGKIVRLRKIEGWSQKRIAEHLGTTEKAIEKQVWLGVKLIREAWARGETEAADRFAGPEHREGRR